MKKLLTKKTLIILGITIFMPVISILLIKLTLVQPKSTIQPTATPQATQVPPQTQDNPPVQYNVEQTQKMMDFVDRRRQLSPSDQRIREQLTQLDNPLSETADYSTEYVSAPDEFMVEIRTVNINKAKEEATAWFQKKGLSHEGICHLPLNFYINYDTAEQLRGLQMQFDPLPLGC